MIKIFFLIIVTSFSLTAQTVVVNKFFNSGKTGGVDDAVELLVVQKNLNMKGMILKDFSSSMNGDNGGRYIFKDVDFWGKIPSGTLIVIQVKDSSADLDTTDYIISVGLRDTSLFTSLGGTFDIATTELVMIKASGSDPSGTEGSIHGFGSGSAGTFFNQAPNPKLRSTGTTPANKFAFARNTTSSITDFDGTDADTSSALTLGLPNNSTNELYINRLRGLTSVDNIINPNKNFILFNNYPNPFNPSTNIKFYLDKDSNIELKVYNALGNLVTTLVKGYHRSGSYEINFNAKNLPGGVYFYELKTDFGKDVKRMIFVK